MNEYNETLNRYENNLIYKQEFINRNSLLKVKINILNKRIKKSYSDELDFNEIQKYNDIIETYTEELNFNSIKIEKISEYLRKDRELLNKF